MRVLRDSLQTSRAMGGSRLDVNPSSGSYVISTIRDSQVVFHMRQRSSNGRFGKTVKVVSDRALSDMLGKQEGEGSLCCRISGRCSKTYLLTNISICISDAKEGVLAFRQQ